MVQNGTLTATGSAFLAQSGVVSAVLAGTQALVKSGEGTLVLSLMNMYSGGTTVHDGTLLLSGGNDRLSTLGDITSAGGVLDLGGNSQTTLGTITFAGGIVRNGTLTGNGTTYVLQSGTVSAEIGGLSGVVKSGTGAASLSGVNTYSGGTTVWTGTLQLAGGDDRLSTSGFISVNGGVLDLHGNSQSTAGTITFAGGLVQNGTLTATGAAFLAQAGTVSAVLAGTQSWSKSYAEKQLGLRLEPHQYIYLHHYIPGNQKCIAEMTALKRLAERYKNKLQIITFFPSEATWTTADKKAFEGANWQRLDLPKTDVLWQQLGWVSAPSYILLDAQLKVLYLDALGPLPNARTQTIDLILSQLFQD
jgi:autotransporter-associated beta strand protein